ncbi:MAG: M28 family peptidase [Planctomycetes bacterium]|nr:M28 family peptidase [Planctomycetota bacterium]
MSERYPDNPFFQIYTLDLDSGHSRLISPGVGRTTCAYFRPGTDQVLFASTHLDPQAREAQRQEYEKRGDSGADHVPWVYDEHFDIFSCDRRGRDLQRLTDSLGYDAEGAYSPDGKLIVFGSMRDAYPLDKLSEAEREIWEKQPSYFGELYIMNADGSGQRRLTDWPGYDGGPFFAAENDRVIWRHFGENGLTADVYTIGVDGTDKRRLTDFKSMSWAPYMHPSREYAVFVSNKLGFQNFELFIVDSRGEKEPVRVTYTDGFDGLPVFSPDGQQLCWTSRRASPEPHTGQLFIGDWDHEGALAAIKAAPQRGTPEREPESADSPKTSWPAAPPPAIRPGLTAEVTDEDLYEHVGFLASDKLEGRMTGSKGAQQAGQYIAERFAEAGLEPLGDNGTFFQEFTFSSGVTVAPEKNRLMIHRPTDSAPQMLKLDEDYRPLSFADNDAMEGDIVCVGYGLVIPEEAGKKGYDSYKGLDVRGKIVLAFDDVPANLDTDERIRWTHYSAPRYKAKLAIEHGAVGFLLVVGPNTAGAGTLLPLDRSASSVGIVAASISISAAELLLGESSPKLGEIQTMLDEGDIPDHFAQLRPGSRVTVRTHLDRQEGKCRNVVGLLPPVGEGSIADQYIVVGAHYDHIGHGEGGGSRAHAGEEGQIHNGADDNASGTATVLELAAALAEERGKMAATPIQRRGVIFSCWSGEELGVIGSTYFARHAPCPLGQIMAYVNFDMVGRLDNGKLILQGVGSSPGWPRLIEKTNVRAPLAVVVQNDPYLPTDTHEFYPAGIPILSFFTDVHDDYNRPTDDADTLNYVGMQHIAAFARYLLTDLVIQPERLEHASVKQSTPMESGGGGGGGRRIYTGTIPDFTAGDVGGMKISGVQEGSPAQEAGMVGGDVIIKFANHAVNGLEDYAVVLRALKPDEPVEITVRRDGQELQLTITPRLRK